MLILHAMLLGCTGEPYTEDAESFRGWCDPTPAVWGSDSRPLFLSKETVESYDCVSNQFDVEELADTEGCSGIRVKEAIPPGIYSFDCIDWDFEVVDQSTDVDLSAVVQPGLLSANCTVAVEADWLLDDAWESGALVELGVDTQNWFFTRGSMRVFPSSSGSVTVNVLLTDSAGERVSDFAAQLDLECDGT
jgi:hypothetical protein